MASPMIETEGVDSSNKEDEDIFRDEDEIGTTDAETSSWESEPNTTRSSRQYHPIKGEQTILDIDDEKDDEQPLFNGDYIPGNTGTGEQELLSSQYLRRTFGFDDAERLDSRHEIQDSNEQTDEDGEFQTGSQMNGQAASSGVDEAGDHHFSEKDEQTDGDVIEELDLTKEPKPMFDRGPVGMPQAQFVFMPSLQFGGSSFDSLMMGLLSSDGDGVENDADVSSQSEAEVDNQYKEKFQDLPKTSGGNEQERWEYLFGMLDQQHRQQVILQREHHERQVKLLKMQLARLTEEQEDLITKQHQKPLGHGTKPTSNKKEHEVISDDNSSDEEGSLNLKDSQKQLRRSPNGRDKSKTQDRNGVYADHTSTNGSTEDSNSASEDSEGTLEGSIEDASQTLMTTWSDVVEQKQAEIEKEMTSNQEILKTNLQEDKVHDSQAETSADDDRFIALQRHFAKQQQQLEEQYTIQARHMQQQWSALQQQQQEQQEILRHLLSQQQERINQQHKERVTSQTLDPRDDDLNSENRGSPTSDDTSMSCSDFTYWKQPEHDTYKALPDISADDVTRDQGRPQPVNTQLQDSSQHDQQQQQQWQQQQQGLSNITGNQLSTAAQYASPNTSGQRSPDLSGQSSSPRRSADDVDMGDDAQHTSSLRLNLREKHARHIADLKAYYEGEIKDLQSKLMEVVSLQDHSPDKVLKRTNQKLQNNCIKLEAALKSANSRIEDLEDTVKALEARLDDTYSSTDSSMANLYQKVNDFKQLCRHKELDIHSLEKRNRELQTSLDQAYQLQDAQARDENRDQKLMKRVLAEYKALAEKHEITKELLHGTETQLYESKAKISNLTRTLANLELDVKRTDLDNSFSRRQNLTKSLSGTSLRSDTRLSTNISTVAPPDKDSKQDRNQTSQSDSDINKLLDSSGVESSYPKLSVEERKFLKPSMNYNVITGEEISERDVEGLVSSSDTESISTKPENDYKCTPGRPSNLTVPFDTDTDEERPLSPMMKAARQFDFWKAEESMNAGNSNGLLGNTSNGTHLAEREDIQRPSSDYRNHSDNNSVHSQENKISPSGRRLDIGPVTSDASIHIWPQAEQERKRSPLSPGSSKLGTALAHSSPKQLARQSLAKAIKPKDHDLFPVKGSKDTYQETGTRSPRTEASHSGGRPPSVVHSWTGKESPRRQLFTNEKKDYTKRGKDGVTSPSNGNNAADSVLAKLRSGDIQTRAEWEVNDTLPQRGHSPKNRTETGHDIIQRINHHQKKLDELMLEKRQLETTLSHVPISGRISRQKKQEEERLEQRLENVTRELGSVRMLLRRYNALKSSI